MVAIAASLARPAVAVASARSAGARRTFMGTPMAQRQQASDGERGGSLISRRRMGGLVQARPGATAVLRARHAAVWRPQRLRCRWVAPGVQVVKARRSLVVKAETSTEGAVDVEALVKDLSEKWDKVENKTSVIVYGAGALVVLWLSATIVGALNNVPLFPKLFELSSREELLEDVEALKKKISGDQ
eukprot:scaffold3.g6610.t1